MNIRRNIFALAGGAVLSLASAILCAGQGGAAQASDPSETVFYQRGIAIGATQIMPAPGVGFAAAAGPADRVMFISAEMGLESRVVEGAPYAAQAVTEHVQTLADGNRIVNRNTGSVYRDSLGRTRRVQTPPPIGPWGAMSPLPETVFIGDPVAGVSYVLDPQSQTARRVALPQPGSAALPVGMPMGEPKPHIGPGGGQFFERPIPPPKVEPLGRQWIEGVAADGTRTVVTIAAGEIGNERAIEIVSERWFSPDLQTVVLSRHSDPRMGENVYRLTGIVRREPDPALFRVPDGYRIIDGPGLQMFRKTLEGVKP